MSGIPFGIRKRTLALARQLPSPPLPMVVETLARAEQVLAEPFVGITTDGRAVPGLFPIRSTGVSTRPIKDAAEAFVASLDEQHRNDAQFSITSHAWQRWSNTHPFIMRHGALLEELDPAQRALALGVVETSLSARGFTTARDVMHLNETVAEITGSRQEYGEWLYWLSIFGRPSLDTPWGWQLDGHHLNLNCLVLGDQVVMTPMFMGAEPTFATSGKYAGTRVFQAEEQQGLEFVRSLSREQQNLAILFPSNLPSDLPDGRWHPTEGRIQFRSLRDNVQQPYEGIAVNALGAGQREQLLKLMQIYLGRLPVGHDRLRLDEVRAHLAETHFVWFGGLEDDSTFYYRIHSPVVLIEFDHLRGIAFDNDEPSRLHVHNVVRTPNGNDYGKDLLRQHLALEHAPHSPAGHTHAAGESPAALGRPDR